MFLAYLKRELQRRRRQALVVALGLALGVGLVITVTAASAGVTAAQGQVLQSLYGVGTDITVTQQAERGSGGPGQFDFGSGDTESDTVTKDRVMLSPGSSAIDESTVTKVAGGEHVAAAVGGLTLSDMTVSGDFTPPSGQTGGQAPGQGGGTDRPQIDIDSFTINGTDVSATDVGPLSSATLADGRAFTVDDAKKSVVVLSADYANQKDLGVGDKITIGGKKFSIIGVVTTASGDATDVFMPLAKAQSLADMDGKVSTVYVKATSAADIAAAQSEIKAIAPDTTVNTSADLASTVSGSLASAASLAHNLGTWLAVAVLVAAFALAVLLTISAVSRRVREFGTLKALGWRSRRVIGQVIGEALVQGIIGAAAGVALGFLGAFAVSRFAPSLSATVGATGSTGGPAGAFGGAGGPGGALREAANAVSVHLTAPVTASSLALAVALAVAGGLLAGLFGGWRAARMRPADAMRQIG
jgi:ABC-type lipoprotein release transport system permease subunit